MASVSLGTGHLTPAKVLTVLACCLVYLGNPADTSTEKTTVSLPDSGPSSGNTTWENTTTAAETAAITAQATTVTTGIEHTYADIRTTTRANSTRTFVPIQPRREHRRLCYQCTASSPDEPCVTDTAAMANASTREAYIKDCTDSNPAWDLCMIQTVEVGGKLLFYHRDCHDGKYFPKELNSSRFYHLAPNNLTTCDLIADKVVCYRPCRGDFCNGPDLYVNETDYCLDYEYNGEVTLPPGVVCGTDRFHSTMKRIVVLIIAFLTTCLFRKPLALLRF